MSAAEDLAFASLPERDFPPQCADLYPPDFRYPVGWLPRRERLTNRKELLAHDAWRRPYLVKSNGEVTIDAQHVAAVSRLARGKPDTSIQSALRCLEWGDAVKDPSMNASFEAEDLLAVAALWSEAGAHERAISMIRSLPKPYQETASGLEALVRSLKALERYAEALEECVRLVKADGITEYARELRRIETAELLLHLNRRAEVEEVLDSRQETFENFWEYHGMRAALDLLDGRHDLAQASINKAGRVDAFHSYKLLWNRHLAPQAGYIRAELLTEDNRPRLYELNVDVQRLCHKIHGALVGSRWIEAQTVAETLLPVDVTGLCCSEALALAWTGLGEWEILMRTLPVLPGARLASLELVYDMADFLRGSGTDPEKVFRRMRADHHARDTVREEFA